MAKNVAISVAVTLVVLAIINRVGVLAPVKSAING